MEVTALKSYGGLKQPVDKNKSTDDIFNELLAALFSNVKSLSVSQQDAYGIKAQVSTGNIQSTDDTALNNLITVINQLKLKSTDSDIEKIVNMLGGKTGKQGLEINNTSSQESLINVLEGGKGSQTSKNVNSSSSLNLEKLINILQDKGNNLNLEQNLFNENNVSSNINSDKVMTEIQNIINDNSNNTDADNSIDVNSKNITDLIKKLVDDSSSIKGQDNTGKSNSNSKGQIVTNSNEIILTGEKNKELSKVNKPQSLITDIKKDDADINNKVQTNIASTAVKKESTEIKTPEQSSVISKNSDIVEVTVEKFKSLRLPDLTELKVMLKPKELGEITVKLVLEKGQINGNIIATKKETAEILQSQITTLKHNLEENNIKLNNLSINLKNENNFNGRHSNQNHSSDNRKNSKEMLQTFEDTINEVSDNNINLIA